MLLAALLVLIIGASFLLLSRLNAAAQQGRRDEQTAQALAEAKAALIGFALTYAEHHDGQPEGYLPCPDMDDDGGADPPCGGQGQSAIGRLPRRTLGIPPLRDSAGECLWYAVSGNYKNSPKRPLTSDTDGQFVVRDASAIPIQGKDLPHTFDFAIALIFAPGSIVGDKARGVGSPASRTECGSTNPADAARARANYLDALNGIDNATGRDASAGVGQPGSESLPTAGLSVFVAAPPARDASGAIIFNDAVSVIGPGDFVPVYRRMDRWVAGRVRDCLIAYATTTGGRYPWASVLNPANPPDYNFDANERFGRVPRVPSDVSWPSDHGKQCFDESGGLVDWAWGWWAQWKELVFYGVDRAYGPGGPGGTATMTVQANGALQPTQFVIAASGRRLEANGQSRDGADQRGDINNYLDGDNLPRPGVDPDTGSIPGVPAGDENFVNAPVTAEFNDVVCSDGGCP